MPTQATRAAQPAPDAVGAIAITPPAAQLVLSSRGPRREHTDREREAQMNRERQARWREKDPLDPLKDRDVVEWSGAVLDMLTETGYLDDDETGDSKAVAKAIEEMLEDAAEEKAWRKKRW